MNPENAMSSRCRKFWPWLAFGFLSLFAYFPMLLNTGRFWDDWEASGVMNNISECGYPLTDLGLGAVFSLPLDAFVFMRFAAFFAHVGAALLFYYVLGRLEKLADRERYFLALFAAVMPFNFVRIVIFTAAYDMYVFAFWAGFALLAFFLERGSALARIAALILFFTSYMIPSLLIFHATVIAFVVFKRGRGGMRNAVLSLARHADVVLVPLVFWILRAAYFGPRGPCATYNAVTLPRLLDSPGYVLRGIWTVFGELTQLILSWVGDYPLAALLGAWALFGALVKPFSDLPRGDSGRRFGAWIGVGLFVFIAGLYAYAALGSVPFYAEWNSRHQLLLPFGGAMLLFFGAEAFLKSLGANAKVRLFAPAFLAVVFAGTSFGNYLALARDAFKQSALMTHFSRSDVMRDNTTFLVEDRTSDLNFLSRIYRFYEWTGMMKSVFGDEKRFVTSNPKNFDAFERIRSKVPDMGYGLKDYSFTLPQYRVIVNRGEIELSDREVLKLLLLDPFDPESVAKRVAGSVRVEYVPFAGNDVRLP